MFAHLVFILVTLEKKLLDTGRGIFGGNVFKNPAGHVIIVFVAVSFGKNRRVTQQIPRMTSSVKTTVHFAGSN